MMNGPRWMHRLYAWWDRYFWLPCPLCGAYFGGHEWGDIDGKSSTTWSQERKSRIAICPTCTRAGRGSYREEPRKDAAVTEKYPPKIPVSALKAFLRDAGFAVGLGDIRSLRLEDGRLEVEVIRRDAEGGLIAAGCEVSTERVLIGLDHKA